MRRYDRIELLLPMLGGLLFGAVMIAAFGGCSEKRERTIYLTAPTPNGSPDTVCVDKHGRPCKTKGGKR